MCILQGQAGVLQNHYTIADLEALVARGSLSHGDDGLCVATQGRRIAGSFPRQLSKAAFQGGLPRRPSKAAFQGSLPRQLSKTAFQGSLPRQSSKVASCAQQPNETEA